MRTRRIIQWVGRVHTLVQVFQVLPLQILSMLDIIYVIINIIIIIIIEWYNCSNESYCIKSHYYNDKIFGKRGREYAGMQGQILFLSAIGHVFKTIFATKPLTVCVGVYFGMECTMVY